MHRSQARTPFQVTSGSHGEHTLHLVCHASTCGKTVGQPQASRLDAGKAYAQSSATRALMTRQTLASVLGNIAWLHWTSLSSLCCIARWDVRGPCMSQPVHSCNMRTVQDSSCWIGRHEHSWQNKFCSELGVLLTRRPQKTSRFSLVP